MKSKEEILKRNTESIAKCNVKYNVTHQGILNAMEEYATQCQEDMAKELKEWIEITLSAESKLGASDTVIEALLNVKYKIESLNKGD